MIENVLPFIDGVALYLNKHESPSPNTAFCLLHFILLCVMSYLNCPSCLEKEMKK